METANRNYSKFQRTMETIKGPNDMRHYEAKINRNVFQNMPSFVHKINTLQIFLTSENQKIDPIQRKLVEGLFTKPTCRGFKSIHSLSKKTYFKY